MRDCNKTERIKINWKTEPVNRQRTKTVNPTTVYSIVQTIVYSQDYSLNSKLQSIVPTIVYSQDYSL